MRNTLTFYLQTGNTDMECPPNHSAFGFLPFKDVGGDTSLQKVFMYCLCEVVHVHRFIITPVDLRDNSAFKDNDIIPGGTLTMRIWPEDSWGILVTAAVSGNNKKMDVAGATMSSTFSTAYSSFLGPAERSEWLAHRTFVALFINARRGRLDAVDFLIQNGADVAYKTPLGRTALHVAVTSGHTDCIELLLSYGAKISDEDNDGYNAVMLARLWGQKESERRLFRYQWKLRTGASAQLAALKIKSADKVEA